MIFRRDVEGLRAVAIGGVLVAHANLGFAAGGFCGVDIFYVISGFLITGILVRELEGRGSISLAAFYARRARRILPMAGLVIIFVLLISLVVFSPARRDLLSGDAVASSLYYVNWRFVAQSADYFGPSSDLSPLQHYWSLAIEEQFYLVWPALLLGVTLWWRRRGRPSRRAIAGALTVIAVSSLAFSIVDTAAHPPQAYFSTFTRVWELALGGLLALAPAAPLSRATSRAVAWAGLAMIVAAFLLFDAATPFPGYLALLPTLGAVAVIAAGARRPESPPLDVLEARPVRYVGRVSYSWYLWHWPAVIFATELWGPLSPAAGAAVIAASFVPAVVSHHLVELPLMNSRTLKRSPSRSLAFGAATMAAGVATAGLVLAAQPDLETAPGGAVPGAAALVQQKEPQQTATALRPNPIHADEDRGRLFTDGCLLEIEQTASGDCSYSLGSASTDVTLMGDSHGQQYFAALERIGKERGWQLTGLTKVGCPPSATLVFNDRLAGPYEECQTWRESALERIEQERPDLVILAGAIDYTAMDGDTLLGEPESRQNLEAGYVETIDRLEATGAAVAVISDIPTAPFNVSDCVSKSLDSLDDCGFDVDERKKDHFDDRAAAATGADLVRLTESICPQDHCRSVIGNAVTYRGTNHLTTTFARTLAPVIDRQLPGVRAQEGD